MRNNLFNKVFNLSLVFSALLLFSATTHAASTVDFVTTWTTTAPNETITIPTTGAGYNYTVDWGDTNSDTGLTGDANHSYAVAGTYTVSISGDFPRIFFDFSGDILKIQSIEQWGDQNWTSFERAFAGAENMVLNATDEPDLSNVTSLSGMFNNADALDADLSDWDTSNITNMSNMFRDTDIFDQDIEDWDTSSVEDMSFMFFQTGAFNSPIGDWETGNVIKMNSMFTSSPFADFIDSWDTSSVDDMSFMFSQTTAFDDDLSQWDTSSVENMEAMFQSADAFNQPIDEWDTSSVTNMSGMFRNNSIFNQPLNSWDTSSLQNSSEMFRSATAFNQDISVWDATSLTDATDMFLSSSISRYYYDLLLSSWASQNIIAGTTFSAGGSLFCDQASRNILTNAPNNWIIIDGGIDPNCPTLTNAFVTGWKTTSGNEQITIPINPGQTYDYNVDWGDGNSDTNLTSNASHTYTNAGAYQVVITGDFPTIYFNGSVADGSEDKIISIDQWGNQAWTTLDSSFEGASNMGYRATDAPDLSGAFRLFQVFKDATSFNGDISNWNTATIFNAREAFAGATSFNQDISGWDMSFLGNATGMFSGATSFNQPIGNWTTPTLIVITNIFRDATSFNQDLTGWDTSGVSNMDFAFSGATSFNGNITNWNTSSVTNMEGMFFDANNFNQPITGWNTSLVQNMNSMFAETPFDQNIGAWNVTSLTDADSIFNDASLSRNNYDALLTGWSAQTLNSGVNLGTVATYCDEDARELLTSAPNSWIINDNGLDPNCPTGSPGSASSSGNSSTPFSSNGSANSTFTKTPLEIVNERLANLPISQCLVFDSASSISFIDAPNPPAYVDTLTKLKLDGSLKSYIVEGNSNGELNLLSNINRAEVVITLLSSHCLPILDVSTLPNTTYSGNPMPEFTDLPKNGSDSDTNWLRDTLYTAAYYDIIKGNDDGTVQAGRAVNSAEFFTILARLTELTDESLFTPTELSSLEDIWYKEPVEALLSEGVLEISLFENYDFGASISRDFVFEILLKSINSRNLQI